MNEQMFVKATGTTETVGGKEREVQKARPVFVEKTVGRFGHNNGVLAFVDENRDFYVGPDTRAGREALREAGYEDAGMEIYVPHSNDGGAWIEEHFPGVRERAEERYKDEMARERQEEMGFTRPKRMKE